MLTAREMRDQIEEQIGRPLTAQEWADLQDAFARAPDSWSQLGAAKPAVSPSPPSKLTWPGRRRLAWFAAIISGLVGTGFLMDADLMFSPLVKILLGIAVWISLPATIGFWFRIWSAGDLSGCLVGIFVGVPAAAAAVASGTALIFAGRAYLTRPQHMLDGQLKPVEMLAIYFFFLCFELVLVGWPRREPL